MDRRFNAFIYIFNLIIVGGLIVNLQYMLCAAQIVENGLYINSYPDNAQIYIDECPDSVGNTPLFIIKSTNGIHEIMLTHEGYNDYYERIDLKNKRVINAQLEPKSEKVFIDSLPRGANVFRNGDYIGKTPLNLSSVFYDYSIELMLEGYNDEIKQIKSNDKNILIELQRLMSDLSVITHPDGAFVSIDGDEIGITPLLDLDIEVGRHLISIEKENFEYWQEEKYISYPSDSVSINLTPLKSDILINSIPSGANVTFDGDEIGATPLDLKISTGSHLIQVEKENFEPWQEKIDIYYPSDSIYVNLVPLKSYVSIKSIPSGANIKLDGTEIGVTPLDLEIEAGSHLIRMEKENFEPWQERLDVSDPIDSINVNLRPLKSNVLIDSTPQGADVKLDEIRIGITPLNLEIEPGDHLFELEKNYYSKFKETRVIRYPRDSISIELKPNIFELLISVDPVGAEITMDNNDLPIINNTSSKELIIQIPAGNHEIGIKCNGYKDEDLSINVPEDLGSPYIIELEKNPWDWFFEEVLGL